MLFYGHLTSCGSMQRYTYFFILTLWVAGQVIGWRLFADVYKSIKRMPMFLDCGP